MIGELIAGIGIGLWGALALSALALMHAKKHGLLEGDRDRFLRGDIDTAFDRIEDLEKEMVRTQSLQTELTHTVNRRMGELHSAIIKAGEESRMADQRKR